jgi:hypothetical protein
MVHERDFQEASVQAQHRVDCHRPFGILWVGLWLVGVTAMMLSENPFHPKLTIMIGGSVVVVTTALVILTFIDGPPRTSRKRSAQTFPPVT